MKQDVQIFNLIKKEEDRQTSGIELIASENYVTDQVLEALGSICTNKYAEGYPGARYYGATLYISEKRRNIRQDSVQTIKIYSSAKDAPVLTVNKEAVKVNQTAPCQYVSDPVIMHGRNVVEVKAGELSDQQIITIRNALKQR